MPKSPFDWTDDELDRAMKEAALAAALRAHEAGIPVHESVDGELRLWRPDASPTAQRKTA